MGNQCLSQVEAPYSIDCWSDAKVDGTAIASLTPLDAGAEILSEEHNLSFDAEGAEEGFSAVIKEAVIEDKLNYNEILNYARYNKATAIQELCRLGCPPSYVNKTGLSALHIGCSWGSVDAVKALLECRADPNLQNHLRGSVPLHEAAKGQGPNFQRIECIRWLMNSKANPRIKDYCGEFPVDCANEESVRLALGAPSLIVHQAVQARNAVALEAAILRVMGQKFRLDVPVSADLQQQVSNLNYYCVDNSFLGTNVPGISFRRSKQLADKAGFLAKWCSVVVGADEGDGWLKVGSLFLPRTVNGLAVVVPATSMQVLQASGGLTLDAPNTARETALQLAVSTRWRPGVEQLLAAGSGCSMPLRNGQYRTLAHLAVQGGDNHILRLVLEARVSVNAQDTEANPISNGTSGINSQDLPWKNRTALHYAAELGNLEAARLLLDTKADANVVDARRDAPLHLCIAQRASQVQLEVGSGVRICGMTAQPVLNGRLGTVVDGRHIPVPRGQWLVLLGGNDSSDEIIVEGHHLESLVDQTMKLLLQSGADVNLGKQVNGEPCAMVHLAARMGDVVLLKNVLAARAAIDQQCSRLSLSPLHLAARSKHFEAARVLVEARADLQRITASGKTAAELALANGAPAAVIALLKGEEVPDCLLLEPDEGAVENAQLVAGGIIEDKESQDSAVRDAPVEAEVADLVVLREGVAQIVECLGAVPSEDTPADVACQDFVMDLSFKLASPKLLPTDPMELYDEKARSV